MVDLEDLPKHNLDDNLNDSKKETRSRRKRRTNNVDLPMADIEVFVVVDKDTAAFHGNESLEEYVLTMMNVVSFFLCYLNIFGISVLFNYLFCLISHQQHLILEIK